MTIGAELPRWRARRKAIPICLYFPSADAASIAAVITDVYPREADLVFVVLGDADIIRDSVSMYGDVTELSITVPSFRP